MTQSMLEIPDYNGFDGCEDNDGNADINGDNHKKDYNDDDDNNHHRYSRRYHHDLNMDYGVNLLLGVIWSVSETTSPGL